jgi:hypothetical protein
MTDVSRGLLDVTSVSVPWEAVEVAHAHLRQVGVDGAEGLALWVGIRDGNTAVVRETLIPTQTAHVTPSGVAVSVDAAELRRIGVWLYDRDFQLLAQIHSHPRSAYHSETDDDFAVVSTVGALSLVVPDFARDSFSLERCAAYRLSVQGHWVALTPSEATDLIRITGQPTVQPGEQRDPPAEGTRKESRWRLPRFSIRRL